MEINIYKTLFYDVVNRYLMFLLILVIVPMTIVFIIFFETYPIYLLIISSLVIVILLFRLLRMMYIITHAEVVSGTIELLEHRGIFSFFVEYKYEYNKLEFHNKKLIVSRLKHVERLFDTGKNTRILVHRNQSYLLDIYCKEV